MRQSREPKTEHGESLTTTGTVRQSDSHPVGVPDRDKVGAVKLDRATVEWLEARARARRISVAELLAEYAASGTADAEDRQGLHLKN